MDTVFDFESGFQNCFSCTDTDNFMQQPLVRRTIRAYCQRRIYQIDYNKDIIFVPNDTEQSIFKRNLMTNADSIMVFTDSRLSTVNTGYLNDGNVAVLKERLYKAVHCLRQQAYSGV